MPEAAPRGRVVLITGAAGGFGRAAAARFAATGATLALSDREEGPLEALCARLEEQGVQVLALPGDVAEADAAAAMHDRVLARFGRLDVAINNAGVVHAPGPIERLPVAEFDRVMAVNARGVFLGLQRQIPAMAAGGGGVILNVASAAGLVGAGGLAGYAASKHAVVGLTRAAADAGASRGVRVNAICPSFAQTPMLDALTGAGSGVEDPEGKARQARLTARVPMGRVATAEEVAAAMLWLCSEENSFMTGQAIALDGGLTAI